MVLCYMILQYSLINLVLTAIVKNFMLGVNGKVEDTLMCINFKVQKLGGDQYVSADSHPPCPRPI